MTGKDSIYRLISSLTKAEKRFFRLFAGNTEGEKNYLTLFTALDKLKEYDEEKLKQALQGERFLKNLSYEKNYLQKQILKALRIFHSESDVENQLNSRMMDINILKEKGLYEESREAVLKTKRLASKFHKHEIQNLLIKTEAQLDYRIYNAAQIRINKEKHFKESAQLINYMSGFNAYKKLYDQLWLINTERGNKKKQLSQLQKNKLLKKFDPKLGFNAEYYFNSINSICRALTNDVKGSVPYMETLILLFERNPSYIYDNPTSYYPLLNNLLGRYAYLGEEKKFFDGLQKLRELPNKIIPLRRGIFKIRIIQSAIQLELGFYIGNKLFKKGLIRLPELLKETQEHEGPDTAQKIVFHSVVAALYFFNQKYKECLKHVAVINDKSFMEHRKDLHPPAFLLRLCCYYELKDVRGMELALNDLKRMMKTEKLNFRSYQILCDFFSKALNNKESFSKLHKELVPIMKVEREKNLLKAFDFMEWVEHKLQSK